MEDGRLGWKRGGRGGGREAEVEKRRLGWRRMGWRPRHQSEGPGKDRYVDHITVMMKHNV